MLIQGDVFVFGNGGLIIGQQDALGRLFPGEHFGITMLIKAQLLQLTLNVRAVGLEKLNIFLQLVVDFVQFLIFYLSTVVETGEPAVLLGILLESIDENLHLFLDFIVPLDQTECLLG